MFSSYDLFFGFTLSVASEPPSSRAAASRAKADGNQSTTSRIRLRDSRRAEPMETSGGIHPIGIDARRGFHVSCRLTDMNVHLLPDRFAGGAYRFLEENLAATETFGNASNGKPCGGRALGRRLVNNPLWHGRFDGDGHHNEDSNASPALPDRRCRRRPSLRSTTTPRKRRHGRTV